MSYYLDKTGIWQQKEGGDFPIERVLEEKIGFVYLYFNGEFAGLMNVGDGGNLTFGGKFGWVKRRKNFPLLKITTRK